MPDERGASRLLTTAVIAASGAVAGSLATWGHKMIGNAVAEWKRLRVTDIQAYLLDRCEAKDTVERCGGRHPVGVRINGTRLQPEIKALEALESLVKRGLDAGQPMPWKPSNF